MHAPTQPVPCADAPPVPAHPCRPGAQRARFALYFTPPTDSAWSAAGCQWLGRDAHTGMPILQPQVGGVAPAHLANLTAGPRRYGFHATLKAPFALADGRTEAQLLAMAADFCRRQAPVPLHGLGVRLVRGFLALCAVEPDRKVKALAQRCVEQFDCLRAPPTADYLARRRRVGLSARQEALLLRWGYPYTEEAFRFHMTLSDNLDALDAATVAALLHAADLHFAQVLAAAPLRIDGLTVLKEAGRGAPFLAVERFAFSGGQPDCVQAHA